MRVDDAAARIGVTPRTIWRWIADGKLRTDRVPVPQSDCWRHDITVDALVDARDTRTRTHCRSGHELTEENTRWDGSGAREFRRCRLCDNATRRIRKHRNRERQMA